MDVENDSKHPFLEVKEDEAQRMARIETLLQGLSNSSCQQALFEKTAGDRVQAAFESGHTTTNFDLSNKGIFDFGNRVTWAVEPPTELLSRIRTFLPQLEVANAVLAQRDPKELNIEYLGEGQTQYVEMDLGLGVFESNPSRDVDMLSSDSSSSDSSFDSDSEDEIIINTSQTKRPVKPLPRRTLPKIIVLESPDTL
ncbi:hypothetical protein C8J56DRAFT_923563 [Mycena floridula]|nr:hypothetical protein C8J56DRAFT_923563 [Mycena floridula]